MTIFKRLLAPAGVAALLTLLAGFADPAQAAKPLDCPNQVVQNFPLTGTVRTTWTICWHEVNGNDSISDPNGLVIGPVFFKTSPTAAQITVLYDMRVSEYFVPYHSGSPRFYDLSGFNFALTGVNTNDCPAAIGGTLLSNHVCMEVRDRGLFWKDFSGVRRGQEVVLWGAINAGNYRYIQEYTFRDDGIIMARMGATGQNLPGAELEPHAHNAVWRIDMDLAGPSNTVAHLQHNEDPADPSGQASDSAIPLTEAQGFTWNARTHDVIQIANPAVTNRQGDVITYHLIPLVTGGGLTRHREQFTQVDFWVTPYKARQFAARRLPKYVSGGPSIGNDVVVWYKGSMHHMPRSEDGIYNSNGNWIGTTDVVWAGFMLMPHGLFDCSPFYTNGCPPQ